MAYVLEYKAPHKLTAPHLRAGLRPMDVHNDVVNRSTVPVTGGATILFQYHADRLVTAAVTQTFHYMIEGGLEYGLLTTGEAIVFLRVDWTDPTTLFYPLAEPASEVLAHPEAYCACTAVAQVLAFSLMALSLTSYIDICHPTPARRQLLKNWGFFVNVPLVTSFVTDQTSAGEDWKS